MDFIEAMNLMKNGEKIRKSTWKENRYICMNDECSGFSNGKNNYLAYICFEKEDFFSKIGKFLKGLSFILD